jgi:hypothetical protein
MDLHIDSTGERLAADCATGLIFHSYLKADRTEGNAAPATAGREAY